MLTSSDPILQILKPHMSKSKTCFEKFVKKSKSFRWHLETWKNEIESISNLNIKKSVKIPPKNARGWTLPGSWWCGRYGAIFFWNLTLFLYSIQKYFQFDFPRFQGAIWKIFSQIFQNRSYFLTYVVLKFAKLGPNLSPYRWWDFNWTTKK